MAKSLQDVKVRERTKSFERVGAGLAVWANAIRALRNLGLADQVIKAGSVFGRATSFCFGRVKTTL